MSTSPNVVPAARSSSGGIPIPSSATVTEPRPSPVSRRMISIAPSSPEGVLEGVGDELVQNEPMGTASLMVTLTESASTRVRTPGRSAL